MKDKKINIYSVISMIFLIFIFLYMLFINTHTHKYHDEFVYSYIYGTTQKCSNLFDVFTSLKNLYNMHNGRIISTGIMCILLMLPKIISDILNSLFFVLLIYLIYKYSSNINKNKLVNILTLFLLFPLLWVTIPEFNGTITWFSGAVNYMWSTVFMLLYMFYIINIFINNTKISKSKQFILLLSALIVGSLHESIGIILTSFLMFLFLYEFILTKQKNKLLLSASFCSFIGFLSIIISPGIKIRQIATSLSTTYDSLSVAFNRFIDTIISNKIIFILMFFIVFYCFYSNRKNKQNLLKNKRFMINIFFIISAILVYIGMIKSPTFAQRVTFAPYIMFLLAFLGFLDNIKNHNKIKAFLLLFLLIYFSLNCIYSIKETTLLINNHYEEWKIRDEFIKSEKNKGKTDILLEPINTKLNDKMYGGDISYSLTYNHNGSMAMFYNVNSIRLKKNYYIDLNFSNLSKECNNSDITLCNKNELLTEKITILPKNVYEKQAPFKKYKHSVEGGGITLYYGINTLDNLTIKFNTNSKIFYLDNILLYNYSNINHTYNANEIKNHILNLNDIKINIENNKLVLNIIGNNPYLNLKISSKSIY